MSANDDCKLCVHTVTSSPSPVDWVLPASGRDTGRGSGGGVAPEGGVASGGGVAPAHAGDRLRHVEEDVLIPKKMRARAMSLCAGLVKEFEDCVRGRTVSAVWACGGENKRMKECLTNYYMNKEFYEECKQEYLMERDEYLRTGKRQKMKRSSSS